MANKPHNVNVVDVISALKNLGIIPQNLKIDGRKLRYAAVAPLGPKGFKFKPTAKEMKRWVAAMQEQGTIVSTVKGPKGKLTLYTVASYDGMRNNAKRAGKVANKA